MWISSPGRQKHETLFARGVINNHLNTNLVNMLRNMQELSDSYTNEIQRLNVHKAQLPILVHPTLNGDLIC